MNIFVGTNRTIELARGDITRETSDAIVNAANSSLMGGGGVDGAIHRAGGPQILEECKTIVSARGRLPAGEAVATTGGRLAARYVIHTVGPYWRDGAHGEADTLARCYRNSLALADELGLSSLAFPSISTGAYRYPVAAAAKVALAAVRDGLAAARTVERVRFILFDQATLDAYEAAAAAVDPKA